MDALLASLWDGESFFALGVLNSRKSKTTSLLNLLPIVAGELLPPEVHAALAAGITSHLTEFGPATQIPGSEEYEADGYWRGPIWAPSTVLIEDGLRRSGHVALANTVSERFRRLCEKSGFAENFDALTGDRPARSRLHLDGERVPHLCEGGAVCGGFGRLIV